MKLINKIILLLIFFTFIACEESEEIQKIKDTNIYTSQIDSIVPAKFQEADTITIYGSNFGDNQASLSVILEGDENSDGGITVAEDILNWENNQITIIVPDAELTGLIKIGSQQSNTYFYELDQSIFIFLIQLFVQISLAITVVYVYLKINKIWKRKQEREVAEAQSLTGLVIFILNCILWVFYYIIVEDDWISMIDTSIYIFEGGIFFIIGTGIFVKGQRKENLWLLIRKALKLERKEADYLLKKWFKPQNAESIIHILHQIAMIDEEFDPKEQEIIQTFAKEWNIDYNWDKLETDRKASKDNSYMRLRKSLEDYLYREPPDEQVAQLKDMITTMIEADEKVTDEEALISSELIPMIENYLKSDKNIHEFKVLVVPQHPDQENSIKSVIPSAEKISTSGGEAFSVGTYYSHKYAEMMCDQYRELKFFTIVNTPPGSESR